MAFINLCLFLLLCKAFAAENRSVLTRLKGNLCNSTAGITSCLKPLTRAAGCILACVTARLAEMHVRMQLVASVSGLKQPAIPAVELQRFPLSPVRTDLFTAPMSSLGIIIVTMRGACGLRSGRGSARVSWILSRMCIRPSRAC